MDFTAIVDPRARSATGCAVIGVFEGGDLGETAARLDEKIGGLVGKLHAAGDFAAKAGDSLLLTRTAGSRAARILLIGLGPKSSYGRKQYRKSIATAAQALSRTGAGDAIIYLAADHHADLDVLYRARIVAEVVRAQLYKIPDLKTGKKPRPPRLKEIRVAVTGAAAARSAQRGLDAGDAIGNGVQLARDLANLPPNVCTPIYLAARAQRLAKEFRTIRTKILNERQIKALRMGAFLAVTAGSAQPPRLIVCEYMGGGRNKPITCLVGKGITFDSGGISLKDPVSMDEMKFDMSGGASVLGALRAIAQLRLPINVVVIIAACENLPSGSAVKPADIVTSMSGQTIEILNTDAEGRLVLCDAITYSRRYKPATVIDVATLTGACVVALGHHFSGLMSNNEALAGELESAGVRADDRAWHMPIADEFVDQLKSNFADLANIGGREGGACTAASFLWKFTKDLNWAHLDVAGTAWLSGAQKGSTGRPVPLLVDFLINRARGV
ncbi:MAG: leucyl aminopeptidase [Steroidobacterales bacterium]